MCPVRLCPLHVAYLPSVFGYHRLPDGITRGRTETRDASFRWISRLTLQNIYSRSGSRSDRMYSVRCHSCSRINFQQAAHFDSIAIDHRFAGSAIDHHRSAMVGGVLCNPQGRCIPVASSNRYAATGLQRRGCKMTSTTSSVYLRSSTKGHPARAARTVPRALLFDPLLQVSDIGQALCPCTIACCLETFAVRHVS